MSAADRFPLVRLLRLSRRQDVEVGACGGRPRVVRRLRTIALTVALTFSTSTIATLAFPSTASAELSVSLVNKALEGKGMPTLTVEVLADRYARLSLELTRSDGQSVSLGGHSAGPGARREFVLKQPRGEFKWEGQLVAIDSKGGRRDMPLSFETVVLPPPVVTVADDAVDRDGHSVTVSVDRPVQEMRLRVQDDEGQVVSELRETVAGQFDGATTWPHPVTVKWTQPEGRTVLRIDVTVEDRHGFYQAVELYPWHVAIPHETVLFETGRSEILAEERPKLEAAHQELVKAIARYGRFAKVQLFIAGHTDTVGDAAANQKLSESRARAIASWFRGRGVSLSVHYVGFGERRPLVATADEVAEARNRRAEYIVAVQPPVTASWKRLK